MYISELKIWNFRKYGNFWGLDLGNPNFKVAFQKGMNILIGKNGRGKTAIIDAIKLILKYSTIEISKVYKNTFKALIPKTSIK